MTTNSLYSRHAAAADRGAWSVERDIPWGAIDTARARRQPDLLAALREAALVESFHPINLARLMLANWDDIDAGVCFSLEAYEGFKHFQALRLYLDAVGYEPRITDHELIQIRSAAVTTPVRCYDRILPLVEFMLAEHHASYFFHRLSEQAAEPVLKNLLERIAADEIRHAQSAADLIAKRIAADPDVVPQVLDAAMHFTHHGADVALEVPVSMHCDDAAIRTFTRRIERLCGQAGAQSSVSP